VYGTACTRAAAAAAAATNMNHMTKNILFETKVFHEGLSEVFVR